MGNVSLKWTEKIFLGICRRIVKCLNIVQLEILGPTFKNFTLSATGFDNFLKTVLIFPMNVFLPRIVAPVARIEWLV
jgi:hypothetical protein